MTTSTHPMKIVVGIDGSDRSVNGLRWAEALAVESSGTVSAVMSWMYPTDLLLPVVGAPVMPTDIMAGDTRAKLAGIVAMASASDAIEQRVVMGSSRDVLVGASTDADLLVVGRTGSRGLMRVLLGSTSGYCVRHADCPVAVIGESTTPEERIVVAVDGSSASIDALIGAVGLAGGREVLAVYAHDEWQVNELPIEHGLRTALNERAQDLLDETVDAAVKQGELDDQAILRQVRHGDPRTTIVDQLQPEEMLILGAQGHSGIARWMLGSLADHAALHAPGTVIIWR